MVGWVGGQYKRLCDYAYDGMQFPFQFIFSYSICVLYMLYISASPSAVRGAAWTALAAFAAADADGDGLLLATLLPPCMPPTQPKAAASSASSSASTVAPAHSKKAPMAALSGVSLPRSESPQLAALLAAETHPAAAAGLCQFVRAIVARELARFGRGGMAAKPPALSSSSSSLVSDSAPSSSLAVNSRLAPDEAEIAHWMLHLPQKDDATDALDEHLPRRLVHDFVEIVAE